MLSKRHTLKIGHFPIVDHLILGVAQKHDGQYFQHVDLQSQLFLNWQDMSEALRDAKLDGTFLPAPLAMELIRTGVPAKIVLLGQREGQVFVVRNEIKSPEMLKGKKIFVPNMFSMGTILLYRILRSVGLDPEKDVTLKAVWDNARNIPVWLKENEVQASMSAEPWGTLGVETGTGYLMAVSQSMQIHHLCCLLVMRDEVIQNSPEAVQELIESLVKAGMFMNAYPHQSAEIGVGFMGISEKLALKSLTHHNGHVLFWDLMPRLEDFEEIQDALINELKIWHDKVDVASMVDASFAQHAYRTWMLDTRREVKDKGSERTLSGDMKESARRLNEILGEVSVVGLRFVRPGEKYPKDVMRIKEVQGLYSEFFDDVFDGNEYVIGSLSKKIKGFALINASRIMEVDRVLIAMTEVQAQQCLKALALGGPIAKLGEYKDETAERDLIATQAPYIFLKRKEMVWSSFSYNIFRFLPLLLSHF